MPVRWGGGRALTDDSLLALPAEEVPIGGGAFLATAGFFAGELAAPMILAVSAAAAAFCTSISAGSTVLASTASLSDTCLRFCSSACAMRSRRQRPSPRWAPAGVEAASCAHAHAAAALAVARTGLIFSYLPDSIAAVKSVAPCMNRPAARGPAAASPLPNSASAVRASFSFAIASLNTSGMAAAGWLPGGGWRQLRLAPRHM